MPTRFTLDGSDALERHLADACERARDGVQALVPGRNLEAVLLGGGYGRGEGGVLKTERGDRPYNDIEVYVCVRGNRLLNQRRYLGPLHHLGEHLASAIGLEVELKLFSLARLRRSPPSMYYYDLVAGHRWILGEEALLSGCDHHRVPEHIPLAEGTRLLMNRGTGLVLAGQHLAAEPFTPDHADFVGRNLAKAQLALGDAVLTVFRRYHWSCRERHRRLQELDPGEELPWLSSVRAHHTAGVEFKLQPAQSTGPRAALKERAREIRALAMAVWLWLEQRRLGLPFASPRDYALRAVNKCPETAAMWNLALNLSCFGPGILLTRAAFRHPRERLFNALSLLLWEADKIEDPIIRSALRQALDSRQNTAAGLRADYQRLWRRFS